MPSNTDNDCITKITVNIEKGDPTQIKMEEQKLSKEGFIQIPVNLTKRAGGYKMYMWYKKGNDEPITNIQFSFSDEMSNGLKEAGYNKVEENLNYKTGGDPLHLWYKKGPSKGGSPITDLFVTTEQQAAPQLYHLGWDRLACNMKRGTSGTQIFLWVKRREQTYISEIGATAGFQDDAKQFQDGFFRVDENTNAGAGGYKVFLWYKLTTNPNEALTDLSVSVSEAEGKNLQEQGFQKVIQDLNQKTGGSLVNVWFQKKGSKPIKTFTLIDGPLYKLPCQRAGLQVINKNLNEGNTGAFQYLCFYQ